MVCQVGEVVPAAVPIAAVPITAEHTAKRSLADTISSSSVDAQKGVSDSNGAYDEQSRRVARRTSYSDSATASSTIAADVGSVSDTPMMASNTDNIDSNSRTGSAHQQQQPQRQQQQAVVHAPQPIVIDPLEPLRHSCPTRLLYSLQVICLQYTYIHIYHVLTLLHGSIERYIAYTSCMTVVCAEHHSCAASCDCS
jgi:hypothetical protein